MDIDKLDKHPLRLKQVEKFFVSGEIDTKLILQVFKAQETKKLLNSSRAHQFTMERRVQKQPNYNFLHIAGKQLPHHSSKQIVGFRTTKRQAYSVKLALQKPLAPVIQMLSHDPDRKFFEQQLCQLRQYSLQKLTSSAPKKINEWRETQAVNHTRYGQSQRGSKNNQYEHCKDLVLSNPILLRKLVIADNSVRKKQKIHQITRNGSFDNKVKHPLPRLNRYQEHKQINLYQDYREFQVIIGLSNMTVHYPPNEGQYKAVIANGNNSLLIKSLLQSRPWWALRGANQLDSCNFIWTEWKKSKIIKNLPATQAKCCLQQHKNRSPKVLQSKLLKNIKLEEIQKLIKEGSILWKQFDHINDRRFTFSSKIDTFKNIDSFKYKYSSKQYNHIQNIKELKMYNHVPGCLQLHSKKELLFNLKHYLMKKGIDINSYIPITFHIKDINDYQMKIFNNYFQEINKIQGKQKCLNVWICKPGQNSNRGNGIVVLNTLTEIQNLVQERCQGGRTIILQKYFQNPFLYNKRKFDIRCYILITTVNGILKGYWYEQGYIRTASKQYSLKHLSNKLVHLTNDAIQKKGQDYGKFQHCNKVSYLDFQKYVQTTRPQGTRFSQILKQMKKMTIDLIQSVAAKLNPKRRQYAFQLFGLDFMLDDNLKPYIIQANSNPCLELGGVVLGRVIPSLIENVFRVAVDPIFPPPKNESIRNRYNPPNPFQSNKMVLIYDSYYDSDSDFESVFNTNDGEQQIEKEEFNKVQ